MAASQELVSAVTKAVLEEMNRQPSAPAVPRAFSTPPPATPAWPSMSSNPTPETPAWSPVVLDPKTGRVSAKRGRGPAETPIPEDAETETPQLGTHGKTLPVVKPGEDRPSPRSSGPRSAASARAPSRENRARSASRAKEGATCRQNPSRPPSPEEFLPFMGTGEERFEVTMPKNVKSVEHWGGAILVTGKFKGLTYSKVAEENSSYAQWITARIGQENLHKGLKDFAKYCVLARHAVPPAAAVEKGRLI